MSNILQKSLDVTYEDFLKGVFGTKSKPEWNALKTLFSEIVTGKSTLVSDMSRPLRADASRAECKRAQERVSGWLGNYDFVEATGGWLLKNIPEGRLDGCTFAVDFSDISKVFGGGGMEGMAMGRDGSTGEIRMGHDFICVSLVGADYPEALPVYVKLGRGRKGHDELIAEIMVQGKPIMDLLGRSPAAGFIFGHIHRWGKGWQKQNRRRVVKWMSLPSTGHWGDIGYAILRTSPKGAEATLRQSDFFIPLPTRGRRPEIWDVILAENQGARCLFPFGGKAER